MRLHHHTQCVYVVSGGLPGTSTVPQLQSASPPTSQRPLVQVQQARPHTTLHTSLYTTRETSRVTSQDRGSHVGYRLSHWHCCTVQTLDIDLSLRPRLGQTSLQPHTHITLRSHIILSSIQLIGSCHNIPTTNIIVLTFLWTMLIMRLVRPIDLTEPHSEQISTNH